jgi:hypothetical protein
MLHLDKLKSIIMYDTCNLTLTTLQVSKMLKVVFMPHCYCIVFLHFQSGLFHIILEKCADKTAVFIVVLHTSVIAVTNLLLQS